MVTKGEREVGINWKIWIDIYTLIDKIDNKDLLHYTGNST